MSIDYRLKIFSDIISSCHNLYLWTFDSNMNLLDSNCPKQDLLIDLAAATNHEKHLYHCAQKYTTPTVLSSDFGSMWIVAPEKVDDELKRVHCLGPFFIDSSTPTTIEMKLRKHDLSKEFYLQANTFLKGLPTISLSRIFEYSIMLHHCITQEKINAYDIHYKKENQKEKEANPTEAMKLHGTYAAEQEMLRYVREGNLAYREHMDKMRLSGNIGTLSKDTKRQLKNLLLVCITLFSRAAIEGGLAAEISLTLTDYYFQQVEDATSMEELESISHTMQEDFITRVHHCRYDKIISKPIRTTMEYMDLHLEDEISLDELANLAGYSDYYFSKRFKREVGQTPKEYLRSHRLERAKQLLRTTSLSIQDICCRLHFSSQSYFADAFHNATGVTPTAYRNQNDAVREK